VQRPDRSVRDASGIYTFNGLTNGSYTVTPSKFNYTFTPASLVVTINGAAVSGGQLHGAIAEQQHFRAVSPRRTAPVR